MCLVVELVTQGSLYSLLQNKQLELPWPVRVQLALHIALGLEFLHDQRPPVLHRDLKSLNVLVDRDWNAKLADFGLAKAASQLENTDPGVVKGKMAYLSPEAARGEDVDPRADIFAVGILMYEMLTGKRLFYGETDYQTVELVRAAKVPGLAQQNPEVEEEIEDICRKALAKRADDRFQGANDLQDALAHYLFSRGLKMIQRDIADLVRACIEDMATVSGTVRRAGKPSMIDTLLHEEIESFTSMDFQGPVEGDERPGPRDTAQMPASAQGEYIDPRAWSEDADWPGRRTGGGGRRSTGGAAPHGGMPVLPAGRAPSAPVLQVGQQPRDAPLMMDELEAAFEPGPNLAPQPPRAAKMSKALLMGVLLTALLAGAAIAAVFAR
jgi:serine/threonine-protein kinase